MTKLFTTVSAVLALGFAGSALADDHAEFDLKAACEAFKADNPESKTDCQCLADKAADDKEAMSQFAMFDPESGEPLGEAAAKVVAACQPAE